MLAATAALSDSVAAAIGIKTRCFAKAKPSLPAPCASPPMMSAQFDFQSAWS